MMSWVGVGLAVLAAGLVVATSVRARARTERAAGMLRAALDQNQNALATSEEAHGARQRRLAELEAIVRELEERLVQAQKM